MSDALIITLSLFAAIVQLLARPCGVADLRRVKAPRVALEALAERAPQPALTEAAPDSEPGFADGLTAAA